MPEEPDHALVPVPPPLIFVGYLAAALLLHWAMPLSAPWPAISRLLDGLAIVAVVLLIYLGLTFVAGTLWGLILSPFLLWTVTRVVIQPEEAYLSTKFQDTYADYRSRVRRWI